MKKIIVLALALLFIGCSEDKKSTTTQAEPVKEVATKQAEAVAVKESVVEEVKAEAVAVKESVAEEVKVVVAARTGKDIFAACAACHGTDASKKALGNSQIIKGWDSEKITNALNGYKDGTYGGAMKGLMKGQASALSDEEIKAVSEYISKL
jgi:cytochrome c553